ncbi:MAG: hypothetical protein ALECFALPRED_001343, partial [Alectoria fallacina]
MHFHTKIVQVKPQPNAEADQDGPATAAETDTNYHVTQQGPDRKCIQQKQMADMYMEVYLSRDY